MVMKFFIGVFMSIALLPQIAFAIVGGAEAASPKEQERNIVGAPLFVSTPAFGTGIGGVGIYLYDVDEDDEVSPKSAASLVGMYSNTDSYFAGFFTQAFFDEDTWRAAGGLVTGKINNEFDIEGYGDIRFATRLRAAVGAGPWGRRWRRATVPRSGSGDP